MKAMLLESKWLPLSKILTLHMASNNLVGRSCGWWVFWMGHVIWRGHKPLTVKSGAAAVVHIGV